MKIFLDSATLEEIQEVRDYGILDGLTTNPSLIKKAMKDRNVDMQSYINNILKVCQDIPVSLEVISTTYEGMVEEGLLLHSLFSGVSKNICVKIPVNPAFAEGDTNHFDSIRAIKFLSEKGIAINATLVFTPEQALLAAKAGAEYVSPFAGRIDDYIRQQSGVTFSKDDYFPSEGIMHEGEILDDCGIVSGLDLVEQIVAIFDEFDVQSEVIAASLRNPQQVRDCALAGADIATIPFTVIKQLLIHHQTMAGMQKFIGDVIPEYAELFNK